MLVEKTHLTKIFMNIMDFSFTLLMSDSVYINYFIMFYCLGKFSGSNHFVSTPTCSQFLRRGWKLRENYLVHLPVCSQIQKLISVEYKLKKKVLLASATLSVTAWVFQRMKSTEEKNHCRKSQRERSINSIWGLFISEFTSAWGGTRRLS